MRAHWNRFRLWILGRTVCLFHGETRRCSYWPYAEFMCGKCQTAVAQRDKAESDQREQEARIAEYAAAIRRCKPEVTELVRQILEEEQRMKTAILQELMAKEKQVNR